MYHLHEGVLASPFSSITYRIPHHSGFGPMVCITETNSPFRIWAHGLSPNCIYLFPRAVLYLSVFPLCYMLFVCQLVLGRQKFQEIGPSKCLFSPSPSLPSSSSLGVWDMRGKQFHRGAEIESWALIVFAQYRYCPEDKLKYVRGQGSQLGGLIGWKLKQLRTKPDLSIFHARASLKQKL